MPFVEEKDNAYNSGTVNLNVFTQLCIFEFPVLVDVGVELGVKWGVEWEVK